MEASQAEKNTFGEDMKLHPVTKRPLEQGKGSLPAEQQAILHLQDIERETGKEATDIRKALGVPTSEEVAAAAKAKADEEAKKADDISKLHARIAELETQVAELTKDKA